MSALTKITGTLGNIKTRTMLLTASGIFLVGIVVIVTSLSGGSKGAGAIDRPSNVAQLTKNVANVPGGETSDRYIELQKKENEQRAEEAAAGKGSSVPTILGKSTNPLKDDDNIKKALERKSNADLAKEARETAQKRMEAKKKELAKIKEEQRKEQDRLKEQRRKQQQQAAFEKDINQLSKDMQKQATAIIRGWTKDPKQAYVKGVDTEEPLNPDPTSGTSLATEKPLPLGSVKETVKAGTVYFAVLETAINTDEPGPVMAKVVSGKYNGSKLMGSVQAVTNKNAQKITVNFSKLILPNADETITIQAVAIDPETARTALASEVNNHYLLRYGSLFASSFLSGMGKAVTNSGKITVPANSADLANAISGITSNSSTNTNSSEASQVNASVQPKLTVEEQIKAGLGEVGQKWGEQVKPYFEMAPTITVDAGTSFGLLFLDDTEIIKKK